MCFKMEFDIYTQEVKINDQLYKLRPLCGRFLPKFFAVVKKFEGVDKDNASIPFDEETIEKLHELGLETFKKSYPNTKEEELDEFVSQNLMLLIDPLMKLHFRTPEEEK